MPPKEDLFQLIWGIALTCAGVMMFFYIPQRLADIRQQFTTGTSFLRFCLYMISILLIIGGGKKIHKYFVAKNQNEK